MTTSYIPYYYASGSPPKRDLVWEEVQNCATYLNNETSHSIYDYNGGKAPVSTYGYSENDAGEEAWVEDNLEELDNQGELYSYDNVVLAHAVAGFGYGGGGTTYQLDSGGEVKGHAVYAGLGAADWEVRGFTWHEIGHSYGVWHDEGAYRTWTDYYGNERIYDITPLCMGYLYDSSGEVDTHMEANDGNGPYSFCNGEPNYAYSYRYSDKKDNHDYTKFSSCTLDAAENGWLG